MWIVVFLLNVYFVSGTCLNGGENHDGTCVCQNGYTGRHCQIEPYNSCVKDTVKQILSNNAVVGGSSYPVCDGTNDNCYYRPGLPVSSKCLATFGSCNDHFTANYTATCDNGCTADAFQEDCCIEHAKCEAHVCAETIGQDTNKERLIYNTDTSGWVITHTEDGACKNDDWRFDKVDLYATIPEVVENCRTFIEFVGLGYACHQTKRWCTGTPMVCFYVKSDAAVHQSECEVGKLQGLGDNLFRLDWATSTATYDTSGAWGFHSLKTHTATNVTKFDTPVYLTSLNSTAKDECCRYTKMCEDYNSQCALPLKNVGSDTSEDGVTPSECCEPKTWRCDHSGSACGTGFKVNTERCGLECATSFTTTLLGEYTGIPITSGSKNNCIGDEQGILTSDECLEKCKGRYDNYFIKNETCYCADGITSQCVADVGSACDCDIEHKTFAPGTPGYYTVSENTLTVCRSWTRADCINRDGWYYLDIQEGGGYGAGQYKACVKGEYNNYYSGNCGTGESNTCCDPIRYDTFRIDTTVTRNESLCCDIDTGVTLTACLSQACPDRHNNTFDYDTGFYTTSHTADCCDVIPDSYYCDTAFVCGDHGKRATGVEYCGEQCTLGMCCAETDHFCDTCPSGSATTGVEYCYGVCTDTLCCTEMPSCDDSHPCPPSHLIDTEYLCSQTLGGACAPSEYEESNKCCIPKETCEEAYTRLGLEYDDRCHSSEYYDSNWNYKKLDSVVDKSGFHRECCKQSCRQLMYERYAGGRGEDTCGDTDEYGTYSWNYDSTPQSNPSATLDDKDWVRKNCCEDSCVKYGADNGLQCEGGKGEVYFFRATLYSRGTNVHNADEFYEHCCAYNCQGMYDSGSRCSDGYMRNEQSRSQDDSWHMDRSAAITDFDSTCCVPKTCQYINYGNYVDSPGNCWQTYGAYADGSMYSTTVSHMAKCCQIPGDCKTQFMSGLTCANGYFIDAVSGVTSDNADSKCCTDTCANRNYDCGDKYDSGNYNVDLQIEQFNGDLESLCCSDTWNCGAEATTFNCESGGGDYCCDDPTRKCRSAGGDNIYQFYFNNEVEIGGATYDTTMLEYSGEFPTTQWDYLEKCRCMYDWVYEDGVVCPLIEEMNNQFRL